MCHQKKENIAIFIGIQQLCHKLATVCSNLEYGFVVTCVMESVCSMFCDFCSKIFILLNYVPTNPKSTFSPKNIGCILKWPQLSSLYVCTCNIQDSLYKSIIENMQSAYSGHAANYMHM